MICTKHHNLDVKEYLDELKTSNVDNLDDSNETTITTESNPGN